MAQEMHCNHTYEFGVGESVWTLMIDDKIAMVHTRIDQSATIRFTDEAEDEKIGLSEEFWLELYELKDYVERMLEGINVLKGLNVYPSFEKDNWPIPSPRDVEGPEQELFFQVIYAMIDDRVEEGDYDDRIKILLKEAHLVAGEDPPTYLEVDDE